MGKVCIRKFMILDLLQLRYAINCTRSIGINPMGKLVSLKLRIISYLSAVCFLENTVLFNICFGTVIMTQLTKVNIS